MIAALIAQVEALTAMVATLRADVLRLEHELRCSEPSCTVASSTKTTAPTVRKTDEEKKAAKAEKNRRQYLARKLKSQPGAQGLKAEKSAPPDRAETGLKLESARAEFSPDSAPIQPPHRAESLVSLPLRLPLSSENLPEKKGEPKNYKPADTSDAREIQPHDSAPPTGLKVSPTPRAETVKSATLSVSQPLTLTDGTSIDDALQEISRGSSARFGAFMSPDAKRRACTELRSLSVSKLDCLYLGKAIATPPQWMKSASSWSKSACTMPLLLARSKGEDGVDREPLIVALLNHGRSLRANEEQRAKEVEASKSASIVEAGRTFAKITQVPSFAKKKESTNGR